MKELNVKQMENINGGTTSCGVAGYAALTLGIIGFGLSLFATGGASALLISQAIVADGVATGVGIGSAIAGCFG